MLCVWERWKRVRKSVYVRTIFVCVAEFVYERDCVRDLCERERLHVWGGYVWDSACERLCLREIVCVCVYVWHCVWDSMYERIVVWAIYAMADVRDCVWEKLFEIVNVWDCVWERLPIWEDYCVETMWKIVRDEVQESVWKILCLCVRLHVRKIVCFAKDCVYACERLCVIVCDCIVCMWKMVWTRSIVYERLCEWENVCVYVWWVQTDMDGAMLVSMNGKSNHWSLALRLFNSVNS